MSIHRETKRTIFGKKLQLLQKLRFKQRQMCRLDWRAASKRSVPKLLRIAKTC